MRENKATYFDQRDGCPVCDNKLGKQRYSIEYNGDDVVTYLEDFYSKQGCVEHDYLKEALYSLIECTNCGLVYQEFIPNDDLMYRLYEKWIDPDKVKEEHERFPLWYYENYSKQLINLLSYFNKTPNEIQCLDFGMGWGNWCLMAKAFGCKAYGMELSEARIKYAEKNGITVLNSKNLSNYRFDYINTDQVFEHLPNPNQTLEFLLKHLKQNGLIRISVPNGNQVDGVLESMDWTLPKQHPNSVNVVAPLEHINCFKTRTLNQMAASFDLEVVDIPEVRNYYRSKKDMIKKLIKSDSKKNLESTNLYFKRK